MSRFYEVVDTFPAGPAAGEAFLNALHDSMPECDRGPSDRMIRLDDGGEREAVCNVYCAQRTCGAATAFLDEHEEAVRARCDKVRYLHGGALEMEAADLSDGTTCHAKVAEFNLKGQGGQLAGACLTCGEEEVPLRRASVQREGETCARLVGASFVHTEGGVPEWFHRAGILSSLPNHFSCDPRYKGGAGSTSRPAPHTPEGGGDVLEFDVSGTGVAPDATIGYWASKPSEAIPTAERAYGDFSNRGIARCDEGVCRISLSLPTPYTAQGKVWKPHVHFTEWKGDRWDLVAKTIHLTT